MDSLIAAAGRALAAGDALGALKYIALREDAPALALRGVAMAQLGEYARARDLLRRATRAFGTRERLTRARCVVAEAEVALAMRDLGGMPRTLAAATAVLEAAADRANLLQARLIVVRRLVLLGQVDDAATALDRIDANGIPPTLEAMVELISAELALRSQHVEQARLALARAAGAALRADVPALISEVEEAKAALCLPAARCRERDGERDLRLDEVSDLRASGALVIDACRRAVQCGARLHSLARRPVLFALARILGEAWPGDVDREQLIEIAFRTRRPDETHRARLRVEVGRLRERIGAVAGVDATARGFALRPQGALRVVVLLPPIAGESASLLALLADGAAWSTSALALALGASQRTVQRALAELHADGRVRSIGRARARRWLAPPLAEITTSLLLPPALSLA